AMVPSAPRPTSSFFRNLLSRMSEVFGIGLSWRGHRATYRRRVILGELFPHVHFPHELWVPHGIEPHFVKHVLDKPLGIHPPRHRHQKLQNAIHLMRVPRVLGPNGLIERPIRGWRHDRFRLVKTHSAFSRGTTVAITVRSIRRPVTNERIAPTML